MSQVYRNAFCNIATTGAFDSAEGIFFERNLRDFFPCQVTLSFSETSDQLYALNPNTWRHHVTQAPLIQRAWVVQERLLAKRVIHFGRHQIMWECRHKESCEIFPPDCPLIEISKASMLIQKTTTNTIQLENLMEGCLGTGIGLYSITLDGS
jgi:hypothetical protein